jgi:GT2 family glycosyltransferase
VRWIVADNSSSDGSAAAAEELGAEVVHLPRNVGFAAANNLGLQLVASRYVAFVNPDVTIDANSLAVLEALIDRYNAPVAPQLVIEDETAQASARGLPFLVDELAHRGIRLPFRNIEQYVPEVRGATVRSRRTRATEIRSPTKKPTIRPSATLTAGRGALGARGSSGSSTTETRTRAGAGSGR